MTGGPPDHFLLLALLLALVLAAAATLAGGDFAGAAFAGGLLAGAFFAGFFAAADAALGASTTAKAPPCGSSIITIQDPPGTSIGPLMIRPPADLAASAALA